LRFVKNSNWKDAIVLHVMLEKMKVDPIFVTENFTMFYKNNAAIKL